MTHLQIFWRRVRETEAELTAKYGQAVFVTSLDGAFYGGKSGVVFEVIPENAAKLIVEQTHRVSTDEEIEAYKVDQARRRDEIRRAEASRTADGAQRVYISTSTK